MLVRRFGAAIGSLWRIEQPSSRLGREIYVLAGLVAVTPIIAIAAVVLWQIEHAFREQAQARLERTVQEYAGRVQERMLDAAEILYQLGRSPAPALSDAAEQLESFAVIDAAGRVIGGDLRLPPAVADRALAAEGAEVVVDTSGRSPAVFLIRRMGGATAVVGQLSPSYLWRRAGLYEGIGLCAYAAGVDAPLDCSMQRPGARIASLEDAARVSGDDAFLGAYSEPSMTPEMTRPRMGIVATVPRELALADLTNFRGLYVPTLCAVVVLALLGALLYARRILYPLARMLDVTKALTERDVWGRAELRRQEEFTSLAEGLQRMADDLSQQFNAREILSQIDQVILSGADVSLVVDLVLRHIVESVQCRRATVTVLGDETDVNAVAASMSRGHPVTRKNEIAVGEESRRWLSVHSTGVLLSNPPKNSPSDPFVAFDTPHTYVLPVVVDAMPAAAVSIMTMDGLELDDIQKGHVRDLAGRLAVALEAVSRSEALRRKAYFDDLTGLPNRDFCFRRLDEAIRQGKHLESAVAVMFIDLDGFKGINDSLGHIAGDELIRQAAYRLSACVGESGTIGRLGGDEFAVVLPFPYNAAAPNQLAERILESIREPFIVGTSEIHLTASVGVARYPDDGDTRVELLRKADTAMYQAKELGRGRRVDYSQTMGIMVDKRLRLEADLRRALENEEFRVFYQPQMDMRTGRIISAEALVRWLHPKRGLILPAEFVPAAEDSGYITVIGGWVMSNACKQLARWEDEGLGLQRVSVNVSAGQFRRHDFIDIVESSLLDLHFASEKLEIELTETVFVDDIKQARLTLEKLKATGVSISIDDFGTGYSSLGYLKHLTFDAVKVDQSFVHGVPGDKKSEAIVGAVLAMCHTLGKQVVAEGIETDRQFKYLRRAGVDIGQGYRIGKPMIGEEFARFLTDHQLRTEARLEERRA